MRTCIALVSLIAAAFIASPRMSAAQQPRSVWLEVESDAAPLQFGASKLEQALRQGGYILARAPQAQPGARITLSVKSGSSPEGFVIRRDGQHIHATGADPAGAMYAALDLAEHVRTGGLDRVEARQVAPHFPFRAVKFNLPFMSYRTGDSLSLHAETCRDLRFWERFLDMMAENRFNVLSLWSLHPFQYMIRPKNFPDACGLTDAELAEWQTFWKTLFRMAKDRGIETYIVTWNIFVSPELAKSRNVAAYSIDWSYFGDADTSDLVARYNRECVTQLIDEYEDLTGLGVSLGERMGKMNPRQREDWIVENIVAGMKAAKRPAKFIHRAPFSANLGSGGSTDLSTEKMTRDIIENLDLPKPIWVEAKFNWSHGHSSPRLHIIHGGKSSDAYWNPTPKNYRMTWMIRNEDFFCLRWGEPDFIREHIATNSQDYTGGYFVGSECYIPAKDYFSKPDPHINWQYAFERQWLFYKLWGRLLYDPKTPDSVFAAAFDQRYSGGAGAKLLEATKLVSRMPLRLASFHKATWDFTLYSEGFIAAAGSGGKHDGKPFISIDELIDHPTLDPLYVSIPDFVKATTSGAALDASRITPSALANALEADARKALELISGIAIPTNSPLAFELADIKAWAHLSLYFADKLRAGVALETYRRTGAAGEQAKAIDLLTRCITHWEQLIAITAPVYHEVPLVHLGKTPFSWERFLPEVKRDIDLAKAAR